jgi:hypothetical protein
MKKIILIVLIFLQSNLFAQIGIGTSSPNSSAILEVSATNKVLLPPRMSNEEKLAIVNPATGLQIWCNNCGSAGEMQIYNGAAWKHISGANTGNVAATVSATSSASAITGTTATAGGTVSAAGDATVTSRGVCWSTLPNPSIAGSKTIDGSGTGSFTSSITGLIAEQTYYVRAYATTSVGTAYGPEISFTTILVLNIGTPYRGGVVAYLDNTGIHGFIAATADQSTGIIWHFERVLWKTEVSGAKATSIGSGVTNTNAIVAKYGAEANAARLCYDLVQGGYSDWVLPSSGELQVLMNNNAAIGGFSTSFSYYWSSSCVDDYDAVVSFPTNSTNSYRKLAFDINARVRAIRYF